MTSVERFSPEERLWPSVQHRGACLKLRNPSKSGEELEVSRGLFHCTAARAHPRSLSCAAAVTSNGVMSLDFATTGWCPVGLPELLQAHARQGSSPTVLLKTSMVWVSMASSSSAIRISAPRTHHCSTVVVAALRCSRALGEHGLICAGQCLNCCTVLPSVQNEGGTKVLSASIAPRG